MTSSKILNLITTLLAIGLLSPYFYALCVGYNLGMDQILNSNPQALNENFYEIATSISIYSIFIFIIGIIFILVLLISKNKISNKSLILFGIVSSFFIYSQIFDPGRVLFWFFD